MDNYWALSKIGSLGDPVLDSWRKCEP
jgi:hypothetical protein